MAEVRDAMGMSLEYEPPDGSPTAQVMGTIHEIDA